MLHERAGASGHASDVFVDADERDARAARRRRRGRFRRASALARRRRLVARGSAAAGAGAAEARALRPPAAPGALLPSPACLLGEPRGRWRRGSPAAPVAAPRRGIDEVLGYRGTLLALGALRW